jgi:AAA15 family ATPase/GTPase
MILSLEIHNFLSHPNTLLEFVPNTNVFVGPSDSGKSAIRDAIEWVKDNRPLGDSFVSWDYVREGKGTFVKIVTDNCTVIRKKDKIDQYILQIKGKKDIVFEAFGTKVPIEIEQALNFSNINIQKQLDPIFLLSSTPGQVAEHWNSVAHLQVIDKATANINSAIRELTSDIKYSEGQETALKESIEKFQYLEDFESEVKVLEELEKQKAILVDQKNKLDVNIRRLTDIQEDLQEYSKILVIEKPVNDILELIELRATKDIEVVKLDKLICQIEEIQSNIEKQNALLLIEKPVNDLLKLYKEKEILVEQRGNLFKAVTYLKNTQHHLNAARVDYASLHLQFEKEMPEICPLCGK